MADRGEEQTNFVCTRMTRALIRGHHSDSMPRIDRVFVSDFYGKGGGSPPPDMWMWNTRCQKCRPMWNVHCVSDGCTEGCTDGSAAWVFLTDGQASPHGHAFPPVVTAVFACDHHGETHVGGMNVHVPYAPYSASADAVLLLVDRSTVRVVAANGQWAEHLAGLGIVVPEIDDDGGVAVAQLPEVSTAQLMTLPITSDPLLCP